MPKEDIDKELAETISSVFATLLENQEPLGEPFASILYSNIHKLYVTYDENGEEND